ncbi:hypothetical protein U27_05103 [Candidatus Vecturithrix granuli]|uniref:ABC transporter substrate binding protein n=1 Tax=Vecturithrix granuli TaxID=1499967 RepID=A0A081C0M5_VECG1|nr:hypothetical protein U27_05103 [Candidatus Vecturithrix granuli]
MKSIVRIIVSMIVVIGLFANIGFAAELKKVMIVYSPATESMVQQTLKGLEQAGFVEQKNLTSTLVMVSGITDPVQLVSQVKEVAPDIVINVHEFGQFVTALKGLSIPIITALGVEPYVNSEGIPTANVTGAYATLPDMAYNSYKFLQKVAPLESGQKAVLLEIPEVALIPKAVVVDALQRLQIPLKAALDTTIYEDWQQAILQYNEDIEVGWILFLAPVRKRDGSRVDILTEVLPWMREHLKKPTISYWEFTVQMGLLCGFCIDLDALAAQAGKLAARVLQGEPINTIKAEYPHKVSIALNRKTATNIGIVFSMEVLKLANVIYDDYEGKQVIRKK